MFIRIVRWILQPFVTLDAWLERRGRPPRPGQPTVRLLTEVSMLNYGISFPPVTAADTATREVTTVVTKDGQEPVTSVATYPAAQESFTASFDRHDQVALTLVDIDGDGNRSIPSETYTFTATDTIPPAQPGQFSVTLLSDNG